MKELNVPLLSDEEGHYIVSERFRRLGLTTTAQIEERIVRTAAGAPTIVHAACLDMAEEAERRDDDIVTEADYAEAIRAYLREHGKRLAASYLKAVETTGPKRLRKQILHAMAEVPGDYATLEDIRTRVSKQLGEDVPSTTLSGPLRALKGADYGPILEDVERYEGGARVFNLTAFRDPMMKSFIRFMRAVDAQGLLPTDIEGAS